MTLDKRLDCCCYWPGSIVWLARMPTGAGGAVKPKKTSGKPVSPKETTRTLSEAQRGARIHQRLQDERAAGDDWNELFGPDPSGKYSLAIDAFEHSLTLTASS